MTRLQNKLIIAIAPMLILIISYWLGGGSLTERNTDLGFIFFISIILGLMVSSYPNKLPWED